MPSAKDKLLSMYQQSPESFGEVLTGDPGSAPAGLAGLVMNPKNAKVIASKLKNFSNVFDYMAVKYPKLFAIPSKVTKGVGFEGGEYLPKSKEIITYGSDPTSPRAAEILGHELTHAYRDRTGWLKDLLEFNGSITPEETIAKRGGATARKTYEKFLKLLK